MILNELNDSNNMPKNNVANSLKIKRSCAQDCKAEEAQKESDYPFSSKNLLLELIGGGYTPEQIMNEVGISRRLYHKWLNGDICKPRRRNYFRLISLYCQHLLKKS